MCLLKYFPVLKWFTKVTCWLFYPNTRYNWTSIWKAANLKFLGNQNASMRLYTVYKQISKFPRMWEALKHCTEEGLLDHVALKWFYEPAFKGL